MTLMLSKSAIKCDENSFNIPELLHEERRTDIAKLLAAYLQLSLIFNAPK
jgi:hypothetical protein